MPADDLVVPALHDPRLVALSVFISILAAYAARDLAERVRDAQGRAWLTWLAGAAVVDGIGTFSMHYTGKLALRLPVPVRFDWRLVVLSLLVSMAGSAAALLVMGRGPIGRLRVWGAGLMLGAVGVSGLHFTAMAALRLQGLHHHYRSPALVALSVASAVVFSSVAIAFLFGDGRRSQRQRKHGSAILRGLANPAMHYTAMAAAVFVSTDEMTDLSHVVSISSLGLLVISIVPLMVIVVGLLTSFADRVGRQRALLDELFEQAPQAVAMIGADDRIVRVNREFTRLFGDAPGEAVGRRLRELIVPAELYEEARGLDELAAQGQRVEVETVRQRKDGSRIHVSEVRVPVSVSGGRVEKYAIHRDITQRKKAEEALKAFPRRLIETQEADRQHLALELHDEVGQALTGLGLKLTFSQELAPEVRAQVDEAQSLLHDLVGRVRNLALDLRPAMLDYFGLVAALLWLFERYTGQTGVRIEFKQNGVEGKRFGTEIETAAYRIVQEALTNVARHAKVREANVSVWASGNTLGVEIEDRGVGFDPEPMPPTGAAIGLAGMIERAKISGGRLVIETSSGVGTRISVELPLAGPTAQDVPPKP
jgi:PAS domain S-box-containing protein